MTDHTQPSYRIIFQPSGRQGEAAAGVTLLDAARALGVGIENICGGRQTCDKCRVSIAAGHFPKYGLISGADHATPLQAAEIAARSSGAIRPDERLACAARICGDLVVNVPPEAQAQKQIVRKLASARAAQTMQSIVINPAVRQLYVEVEPAEAAGIGSRRSDWERLKEALHAQWGYDGLTLDARCIAPLGKVLRAGNWSATVTLWMDREVIALRPGYSEGLYGLAVDLGTTTIAAYLCDLRLGQILATETAMNPQIAYGEDLMSRVSYGMMNPDGANKMHRAVIKALNEVAAQAAQAAGLVSDDIVDMVLVGNPIMHHLFLGIDPVELGGAPFATTVREALDVKARDLGLRIAPGAYVHTLPMQAGHVGADCTAVALAEAPHRLDDLTLIVDIGTNAELLLGDKNGVFSASSPTGPAFEGAQITHGQRAAPGAIERVRIAPNTLIARFKVIGQEEWSDALPPDRVNATGICGSGIIEAVAEMFLSGVIRSDGRFADWGDHPRIVQHDRKPAYVLAAADQTANGQPLIITQDDVRAVQLAKAALYAGAKLLLAHHGGQLRQILLAGAFGSYIDPKHAMVLGLIPDCDPSRVIAVGNAAGDGARLALLSRELRAEAAALARGIRYVETATAPDFQDAFVAAMHIPHMSDVFPHLADVLPTQPEISIAPRRRRAPRCEG